MFEKDIDIDSKLKELTQDFSIPITKLKEFKRIYKKDSITYTNKQHNSISPTNNNTNTHININNNTNKPNTKTNIQTSNQTPTPTHTRDNAEEYLLGEEIELYFKEEWQDKQIRFFAYMEGGGG